MSEERMREQRNLAEEINEKSARATQAKNNAAASKDLGFNNVHKELLKESKKLLKEQHDLEIEAIKERLNTEVDLSNATEEEKAKYAEQRAQDLAAYEKELSKEKLGKFASLASSALKNVKSEVDSSLNNLVDMQESMAYHLNGTAKTLIGDNGVLTKLRTSLSTQGLVKQESVVNELKELVNTGISYNVEQRAYLGTIAQDLGMEFKADSASLTRLVNIQRQDMSSYRFAIEYSLKEFLNQNYETSQYIKEGFQQVSDALLEAQSLLTVNSGMALEATVQQLLGSLSSVGVSTDTVTSIADAIGKLGSGDISILGTNIGKLLAMGAAEVGLDLGSAFNSGLSDSSANALLGGIANYMQKIASSGNNVARNQLASIFGVKVSDAMAVSNIDANAIMELDNLSTDINDILGDFSSIVPAITKIANLADNVVYAGAQALASNVVNYEIYRALETASSTAAEAVKGSNLEAAFMGLGASFSLSDLITTVPALYAVGNIIGGVIGSEIGGASNVFEALATNSKNQKITAQGVMGGLSKNTGLQISGNAIVNSSSTDMAGGAFQEAKSNTETVNPTEDSASLNDIRDILTATQEQITALTTVTFGTSTKLAGKENIVKIGGFSGDANMDYTQNLLALSAINLQNIYMLLKEWAAGGSTANYISPDDFLVNNNIGTKSLNVNNL